MSGKTVPCSLRWYASPDEKQNDAGSRGHKSGGKSDLMDGRALKKADNYLWKWQGCALHRVRSTPKSRVFGFEQAEALPERARAVKRGVW